MKAFVTLSIIIASYTSIAQFSQGWMPLPSDSNITNGPTNGFWFTAESDFTIDALKVPDDAMSSSNAQSITVLKFTGSGGSTTPSANYTVLFLVQDTITSDSIPYNIDIQNGDYIGVIGSRFSTTSNAEQSSNTATSNYSTTIGGLNPNPAISSSTLTFDEPGIQYQVQIVNQHGQLVFLETASNKLQLNCVDLPSGNYFIIAASQKDNILAKLQVIH